MKRLPLMVLLLLVCACGNEGPVADAAVDASSDAQADQAIDTLLGKSCTTLLYKSGVGDISVWPPPGSLQEDPTTLTGVRPHFDSTEVPELNRFGPFLQTLEVDLAQLDGFSVNAPAVFGFDTEFNSLPESSAGGTEGLGIVVLGDTIGDHPVRVSAASIASGISPTDLLLEPLRPLPPKTEVIAYISKSFAFRGLLGCVESSPDMMSLINNPSDEIQRGIDALVANGNISSAEDLLAINAYTTQSTTEQSQAVAETIANIPDSEFTVPSFSCDESSPDYSICSGTLMAADFRNVDGVVDGSTPTQMWPLTVTVFLPKLRSAGLIPTVLFAHGLAGSALSHGSQFAKEAAKLGIATVGISALLHGDHPTAMEGVSQIEMVTSFFGFGVGASGPEPRFAQAREHFRQSTYDKLQLLRFLKQSPDIDGDGQADLDGAQLGYVGVSLGAIMGTELLSLTDSISVAVLEAPGGHITNIVTSAESEFASLIPILRPRTLNAVDFRRVGVIAQTVFDRGDPASFGAHLHGERLVTGTGPDLIMGMAISDTVVTNSATFALMRAIGAPIVPPVIRNDLLITMSAPAPVSSNRDGLTVGMIQFDKVREDEQVVAATHLNMFESEVVLESMFSFLTSAWDGQAVIADPYVATGFPR